MKLIWKFNLVLLGIFVLGLPRSPATSRTRVLQANAREEILQNARLMMEAALASRNYTTTQVKPLLETQLKYEFLPQTVPAYAATEQFNELRKKHPGLRVQGSDAQSDQPARPRDRLGGGRRQRLPQHGDDTRELIGERDTPTGRSLYLARPIQVKSAACLDCHSTVDVAPKTMIDLYGNANGFGWKMNEVIGAQIVSVPMAVPIERAQQDVHGVHGLARASCSSRSSCCST